MVKEGSIQNSSAVISLCGETHAHFPFTQVPGYSQSLFPRHVSPMYLVLAIRHRPSFVGEKKGSHWQIPVLHLAKGDKQVSILLSHVSPVLTAGSTLQTSKSICK